MFKKKKNKAIESDKDTALQKADEKDAPDQSEKPPKKPRKRLKKIIIGILVLAVLGGGGFAGYTFYFKKETTGRQYTEKELSHVTLPPEMIKFSFDNLPELYDAFVQFNDEIKLLETEIQRIETIGTTYPDQVSIADKEKKIWESTKNKALKNFEKIEKKVRDLYVTLQVNRESGQTKLNEEKNDLNASAKEILDPITALTEKLKANQEPVPRGFIKKNIYRIKKRFM